MSGTDLDEVDRGILHRLQRNARAPITAIADAVNVSDNTVRNRLDRLESAGIVRRYAVELDYAGAGFDHRYVLTCSGALKDGMELLERALEVPGVVEGRTLVAGRRNLQLTVVGSEVDDIVRVASAVDDLGATVEDGYLLRRRADVPFDGFVPDDGS